MSIDYRELRAQLRIEDVLRWMSWEAGTRRRSQLRGHCPFCGETNSSKVNRTFSVNTERHIYRCFKCQESGNAMDLWCRHRGLSLYAAAQELQALLGQNNQPPERT